MSRSKVLPLVLVLSAVALASACGSSPEASPPEPGDSSSASSPAASESSSDSPESVQFLTSGAPEELAAFRTLIEAYEASVPGAQVQLVEASDSDDLITRLSTSTAGGEPPDLFLMNYRLYGQLAAKDVIEPLDERISSSSVIDESDYYPTAMEAFRWQGEQLCIPQNISSLAVYYNRDLFEQYGVAEPEPGWTWNDMVAIARALTRDANGAVVSGTETEGGPSPVAVYGLGVEPSIIRLAPFVWSNGGEVVDDPLRPTRFTLDTPEAREALKNLVDLRIAYGVVPTDEDVEAEDDESRFLNGRLGMLMSSRRVTATFRASAEFDWDVASLPVYDEPANILHSDAYCITTGSEHKDDAWRFLEYAVSAEGQRVIAATGRTVPSHIGVAESEAFLDPTQPPLNAQVFLDVIPYVRAVSTASTWPEIEDVTGGLLENAMYRGDRLDDVIAELDASTQPIFARGEFPE